MVKCLNGVDGCDGGGVGGDGCKVVSNGDVGGGGDGEGEKGEGLVVSDGDNGGGVVGQSRYCHKSTYAKAMVAESSTKRQTSRTRRRWGGG